MSGACFFLRFKGVLTHYFSIRLTAFVVFLVSFGCWATELDKGAYLYELGSNQKSLLFKVDAQLISHSPDEKIFLSSYFDKDHHLALKEEARFKNFQIETYSIHQEQLREFYKLDVKNGRLHFLTISNGKTRESVEDLPENLVIGPSFVPFFQKNWEKLLSGEVIRSRLAVLDRRETIGFNFSKHAEEIWNGRQVVTLKMKPASFVISLLVNPVYFTLDRESVQLLRIVGRMIPKLKVGASWKDLDAEAIFVY